MRLFLLSLVLLAPAPCLAGDVDFTRDVRPILADKCFHCHGPDKVNRRSGLRLDTSEALVDKSLEGTDLRGVQPQLVEKVRAALDDAGHEGVRIVVSGGFTAEKIRAFEERGVPVDAYGVGSSLLRGQNDFTADVVEVDGRPCAKAGREVWPNPRLERVT